MRNIRYTCACDRCGKVKKYDTFTDAAISHDFTIRKINGTKYDYCLECAQAYDDFIDECISRWEIE